MNLHSKGHRVAGLAALLCVTCLAAVGQTPASLNGKRNPPRIHGPALRTEKGNYSFRGLQVQVGQTSSAIEIPITNGGDVPLTGVSAATHGDFVVTGTSCSGQLAAGGSEKSRCVVSVAFRPTDSGPRTGDLTIQAAGVRPQVVPLAGGTPIDFPTVQPGATAFAWVQLPGGTTAVSGTVTGPFAIALQASYDYGSINGISFSSSADTNGVCSPDATACGVYLGVQFLGTATPGPSTGTVTLNNGLIYSLSANVLGPGLIFTPSSIDGGSVPVGSTNDGNTFTITNVESAGSAAITLDPPTVSGPFSITNNCAASLAAGATCSMTVSFAPTANGAASGEVQILTGVGVLLVSLTGSGVDNPADVSIDPANINFEVLSTGVSAIRTVKITNLSAADSVVVGALIAVSPLATCVNSSSDACVALVANNCATLAPGAVCQIQLKWQGGPGGGALQIPMTPSSATAASNYIIPVAAAAAPSSSPSTAISLSPSVLQFPATPFGQVSAPLMVTVTNLMQTTATIRASSFSEFVIDPSCGPLAPGGSCTLAVRYVPYLGVPQDSGSLTITAWDSITPLGYTPQSLGSAVVSVSGFGIPGATIASPSYPPLIEPLGLDTVSITNTSTAPLVLSWISGPTRMTPDVNSCSQPIPPGASCSIGVSFVGYDSTLSVYSNAQSSPDVYQFVAQPGSGFHDSLWINQDNGTGATPDVFPMTAIGASTSIRLDLFLGYDFPDESLVDVKLNADSNFTIDNQCPSLLIMSPYHPAGFLGECNVVLTFTPKTPGFHTGSITITTNYGLFTILLAGTGAVSPVSVVPADLLLVAPGGQSDTETVTLTNTSNGAVALSPPVLNGIGFGVSQTTCGSSLAAGASCTIGLRFSLVYFGWGLFSTGQLEITSGMNDLVQYVNLKGVVPQLIVKSNQSSFPPTSIGSQSDILFTLTSFQGAPITLQGFLLNGTNPTDFKIATNTCSAGLVLQGTKSCVIDVAFAPHEVGSLNTTLEIDNTAAVYNANLAGTAAPGPAQVSPATLAFGNENLLVPSAPHLITLSNPNPVSLTLPALPAISGAAAADFSVTGTCTTIPGNASCQLSVTFDPSAVGSRTASLVIGTGTAVDPTTQQPVSTSSTVAFTGVGVAAGPGATVHPLIVHFRRREVGSVSREEKIFLRNPGTTTLTLPAPPAIIGADSQDFRLTGICSSIAAGGHCELGVQFAPTAEGRRSATLSIPTGGSANGPAKVSLAGTGCLADHQQHHERDDEGCERRDVKGRGDAHH